MLFRAAAHEAPPTRLLVARSKRLLGLAGAETLRYADARHGQRRAVRLARDGDDARLAGFLLAGDTRAEAWIRTLLQDELPAQAYRPAAAVAGRDAAGRRARRAASRSAAAST